MAVKYPDIKEHIVKQINEGVLQEGKMLPTERELTAFFHASRMTIRRALDELVQEGKLVRKKGCGVVVAKEKLTRSIERISIHNDEEIARKYGDIHVVVIDVKLVKNHPEANRLLKVDETQEIWQLQRVQYAGKTPVVFENIFLPRCYFKDIDTVDCTMSMSHIIKQTLLIKDANEQSRVSVEAMLATSVLSFYLEIAKGAPILQLNIVAYKEDVPLYCGIDSYDGSSFMYQ